MSLREVLNLKPGTLIRGLKITMTGTVEFSVDGWEFDQRRLVKEILAPVDRTIFSYTYYKGSKIQEYVNNNAVHINDGSNFKYGTFRKNGEIFFKDVKPWFDQENINDGDCLGMSLGENFIALQPSHHDMYRPDYFEMFVFHKILHGDGIKWIALQSKRVSKQLILCNNPSLLDVMLELV